MNAELPERCGNFLIFTYPYIDKSIQCKVLGKIVYLERPDILHAARKTIAGFKQFEATAGLGMHKKNYQKILKQQYFQYIVQNIKLFSEGLHKMKFSQSIN